MRTNSSWPLHRIVFLYCLIQLAKILLRLSQLYSWVISVFGACLLSCFQYLSHILVVWNKLGALPSLFIFCKSLGKIRPYLPFFHVWQNSALKPSEVGFFWRKFVEYKFNVFNRNEATHILCSIFIICVKLNFFKEYVYFI